MAFSKELLVNLLICQHESEKLKRFLRFPGISSIFRILTD